MTKALVWLRVAVRDLVVRIILRSIVVGELDNALAIGPVGAM